jgi:hypothetical protein
MSKGVYGFKTQLRVGQVGEIVFHEANCKDVIRLDGKEGDFEYRSDGSKLELKTDFWRMEDTPNMFIERYSNKEKQTPGGPYQALTHGCEWFVYFYVANLTYFKFNTQALVDRLDGLLPTLTPTDIVNKSHVTQGYRVPREAICDLSNQYSISLKSKKEKAS